MGDGPKGLPGEVSVSAQDSRLAMVTCDQCGEKGRTVSNNNGVTVHCNRCKRYWPISSVSMAKDVPLAAPRGLSKQTLVEPDWSLADQPIGDVQNEQVGPKRR